MMITQMKGKKPPSGAVSKVPSMLPQIQSLSIAPMSRPTSLPVPPNTIVLAARIEASTTYNTSNPPMDSAAVICTTRPNEQELRPQSDYVFDTSVIEAAPAKAQIPKPAQVPKPKSMSRAKQWSLDVENIYRFQTAGFRDSVEYQSVYGEPQLWLQEGFVRCLQHRDTGYFLYFRQSRECDDKYLNKIKIYSY